MNQDTPNRKFNKHEHGSIFGALLIIGLGTILLLNNFNILPWGIWQVIWRFWPVILIVWGMEMVFGKGIVGNLIVTIISISITFFILSYAVSLFNPAYNNLMQKNFPSIWSFINKEIPPQGIQKGNKVFRCNPLDNTCEIIYK